MSYGNCDCFFLGCGSGPFSAGSGSSKLEFKKPDPDSTCTNLVKIDQPYFFKYFYVDFLHEKMEKFAQKF